MGKLSPHQGAISPELTSLSECAKSMIFFVMLGGVSKAYADKEAPEERDPENPGKLGEC